MCKAPTMNATKEEKLPWLLTTWRSLYLSMPKFNFPGTNLDIAFTLFSAAFLIIARYSALWFFANILDYDATSAQESSGTFGSITHSTLLCPALMVGFMTHKYSPSEHRNHAPQWWVDFVDALLQFCTGYMVYDAVFICFIRLEPGSWIPKIQPGDWLFLGHHACTTTYMTQNRVYKAGHMSAMLCMLLGELTNPLHNSYMMSEIAMGLDKGNALVHYLIETSFAISYFAMRVVIAPVFFLHCSIDLLFSKNAKANLPLAVRCFWVLLIWSVEVGSISWIVRCYNIMQVNFGFAEEGAAVSQEL
mmetsp:Transcript_95613/g.143238  ORF Transcript_95613/g.143238 Transcript_95613/m.143238 type:complete len:304 (+) Transcript_95613:124-1035(+)